MQSLDEKSWNEFYLNDIFGFKLAKGDNQPKNMNQGRIPVVSAGETNNGVTAFVSNPDEGSVFQSGTVTVDMFGKAFWHGYDYCAVSHGRVNILDLNAPNNSSQFISTCIDEGTISKYSYNQMCSQKRLTRQKVMLPVTDSGEPDYEYMAEYTRQKRETMLDKYRKYIEARIVELGELVEIPALNEKEWVEFPLNDIFTVGAGKRLETRNKIPGKRPFIGATDNGNGVTGFVGNDNASKDSNVLGVNYNGAPCIAFYHPYECIFTDDVKRLHLRNYKNGKFVLLFFASLFAQQRSKYSYGYKFKEMRMLRQKLMLPIDDSGEPDYAYMEQYSKNMMLRKYKQYLEFINRQNNTEVD